MVHVPLPRPKDVLGHCKWGRSQTSNIIDLIESEESLRKDKARAESQYRVELPKPKASDIEVIVQLYVEGGHPEWSVLAAKFGSGGTVHVIAQGWLLIDQHAIIQVWVI